MLTNLKVGLDELEAICKCTNVLQGQTSIIHVSQI